MLKLDLIDCIFIMQLLLIKINFFIASICIVISIINNDFFSSYNLIPVLFLLLIISYSVFTEINTRIYSSTADRKK